LANGQALTDGPEPGPQPALLWVIETVKELFMAYTEKFQRMADAARARVAGVPAQDVDALIARGAIALDIRDKEEHDSDHIAGGLHVSRGKLEMNIEGAVPVLDAIILCYCNAYNRGALSADTLQSMGYRNARYIEGGLKAYRALG
jgi:phage shock protein E